MENKQINITGKRNTDKILNLKEPKRNDFTLDEGFLDFNKQLEVLRLLYFDDKFDDMEQILKVLEKNVRDTSIKTFNKNKYDEDQFITLETMIELLLTSKLRCKYCCQHVLLFYDKVGEKAMDS